MQKQAYFTKWERLLLTGSLLLIITMFCLFDRENYLTLTASLLGTVSLIFCAKGHPVGQVLMILFSLLYGWISFGFAYYGEMITYLGMTAPMAVVSLIAWLRHPFKGEHTQVTVKPLERRSFLLLAGAAVVVTLIFYGILGYFHTANLPLSTVSVTTSFLAAGLTALRSRWFTLAYAANDVILILLWSYASLTDPSYISVTVCFVVFLVNDIYGFISWTAMQKRQQAGH